VGDFASPLTYGLPRAQHPRLASIRPNRLIWRGSLRPVPQGGRIRPSPPTLAPILSSAGPLPSPPRRRGQHGDATVSAWMDPRVVPMRPDPHGNHTTLTPGRHRCHIGTAGWGACDCERSSEPSLSQKWTESRFPVGRVPSLGKSDRVYRMGHLAVVGGPCGGHSNPRTTSGTGRHPS
jgi:hypothetical protein